MRVGVMARSVRPGASGVGRHAANLVGSLSRIVEHDSLAVFLTRDAPHLWNGHVREVRAPFPTPNEYARALWEQTVVPRQAAALGIDVYHSPNYILPLALRSPAVVTVHDTAYLQPSLHRLTSHYYLSVLTSLALRRARAIIAVSEHTRRAVEAHYPHTAGRIEVIYQGLDPALRRPSGEQVRAFRQRLGLNGPYILFVGTLEPRKNLVRLIGAFEQVVERAGVPHQLFLVGSPGWKMAPLEAAITSSAMRERIHRLGYVPDGDLGCWYAAADLFVYPSLEEGFGLPPLEAMSMGTPVVTSNCSALPEVVGDAALTVDPRDTEALTVAMVRVLMESGVADRLRCAGIRRAQRFTWSDAAGRHLALYRRILSGGLR